MTSKKPGCGWASIPFSLILAILGASYWWLMNQGHLKALATFLPNDIKIDRQVTTPAPSAISIELPSPVLTPSPKLSTPTPASIATKTPTLWDKKLFGEFI